MKFQNLLIVHVHIMLVEDCAADCAACDASYNCVLCDVDFTKELATDFSCAGKIIYNLWKVKITWRQMMSLEDVWEVSGK